MSVTTVVSSKTVQKLKQIAKQYKRSLSITHTEALELAAKKAGFANWHQATQAKAVLLPAETALETGTIIGMDMKDGMDYFDSVTEDGTFIYDELIPMVCAESFRKMMRSGPDPDDELGRLPSETMTEDEFEEWFHTNLHDNMYFRLSEKVSVESLDQVLKLLDERSFWPAFYVWFQGKLYEFEKSYEDPIPVFGS
ncbi:plasmid-related protein [uncultured Marinobacter sp.]|uniref:plasmid-related protein n=1 Tax=uncultured Marinobacter sp. TaxID=187379 RepID=UPI00261B6068|nr:plasmid-related protein [uncultured Marinobacter sp.]